MAELGLNLTSTYVTLQASPFIIRIPLLPLTSCFPRPHLGHILPVFSVPRSLFASFLTEFTEITALLVTVYIWLPFTAKLLLTPSKTLFQRFLTFDISDRLEYQAENLYICQS